MPTTVASPAARTHANSLSPAQRQISDPRLDISAKGARARIQTNPTAVSEGKRSGRQLVRDVMALLRRSQKAFAIGAQCPESDLSNALQDKQRFDLDWLMNQDDEFVAAWLEAVETDRGLTKRARMALKRQALIGAIDMLVDLVYGNEEVA